MHQRQMNLHFFTFFVIHSIFWKCCFLYVVLTDRYPVVAVRRNEFDHVKVRMLNNSNVLPASVL